MQPSKFIATEMISNQGEGGEKLVWDSLQRAFTGRRCLAYWRYPIFSQSGKARQEPDILLADAELGLLVIEVKGIRIEQLVRIEGHRWHYQNFYTASGNPYQQAENQLFAVLRYCDREPLLSKQVTARAIVTLPYITQEQWQLKGFDCLPYSPPILFQEHLAQAEGIILAIAQSSTAVTGRRLTATQWDLLLAVLGGTALYNPTQTKVNTQGNNRRKYLQQVRLRLNQLDLKQEQLAKQIPPGMQRIRGVAGSGKTVILCQKAALMSLKYPQWQIALVFFSRTLYDSLTRQVDRWINHFTQGQMGYDPATSNLKILHAWGSKQQPGFYSTVCHATKATPLAVPFTLSHQPQEALAEACVQLLNTRAIPYLFDAILIDEAQDLLAKHWQYQDKQPFYWLAYQTLRPVNPVSPEQRRLIWAYDELQSLANINLPEPVELFGEDLGHLVTGSYSEQFPKTEVISRCYRTPQQIITIAQAIATGVNRPQGMLTGSIYPEEWQALGFKTKGNWQPGNSVTLNCDRSNSPNIIGELWSGDLIKFDCFSSRQQELSALAQQIKHNLMVDQLQPDQDLLIIVLGSTFAAKALAEQTAIFLINQGLNIYLPGQSSFNTIDPNQQNSPNQFWYPGAVTISTIYRAKGQEADFIYLVGLDQIATAEANIYLRYQLYVALTRTRAWVNISGIGNYPLYQELSSLIENYHHLSFTLRPPVARELATGDRASLIRGYALGRINFRHANLSHTDLSGLNLANINLIEADLRGANLQGVNLTNAKLIAANLSGADLKNADLTNAKLIGADLTDADLTNANLTRANLTNTVLAKS
ncbi:MAG: pentapeptide repeat-containing protein [Cyanobacteria bacterium J06621_8]